MLVCNKCGKDVYIQQRGTDFVLSITEPYYCWYCENFRNYSEVGSKK